jgi:hypothetical protein
MMAIMRKIPNIFQSEDVQYMSKTQARSFIIYFIQAVLHLLYFWVCFISLVSSQSLRELQRDPHPEETPLNFLLYSVTYITIIIALMVLFIIITKKLKVITKPILIVNIILPCPIVLMRIAFSSIWAFSMSGELVYSTYININEIVFIALNALPGILSVYYLIKCPSIPNGSSRSLRAEKAEGKVINK